MGRFFANLSLFQKIQFIFVTLLVLGLPLFFFVLNQNQDNRQQASGNPIQEAESGQLSGNVVIANDTSASGGKYVQFGGTN